MSTDNPGVTPWVRPSWDITWMSLALVMARRSKCARAQVGAVIVDTQHRVVATGYNGPPRAFRAIGNCRNWCARGAGQSDSIRRTWEHDNDGQMVMTETPVLKDDYSDCPSIHAEANALLYSEPRRHLGGSIYTTSVPCFACAKLISNSGILRIVTLVSGDIAHRGWGSTKQFLAQSGIILLEMNDADLS